MNILMATTKGQGTRETDYTFAVEGELVWVGSVCATDQRDPDGGCGCGRGFMGLSSHRATTSAEVRDLPLTRDDVDDMLQALENVPAGTIFERRLDLIRPR